MRERGARWNAWAPMAALVILLQAVAGGAALAQERPRLLLVNDDGIEATALQALVGHLSPGHDVVVVAPVEDRSWAGRSKTTPTGMLRVREAEIEGAREAWAVEGTPVDAVTFGLWALAREAPFDALVAGINRGSTLGFEAMSTGVVGAALEAAAHGLPAIAVAQDRRAHVFDVAAGVTVQLLERWLGQGLPEGTALSVNVPASAADKPRGVVVAPLGEPEYVVEGFHAVATESPTQLWRIGFSKVRRPQRETDLDWYQRGEIIVTPLHWSNTATALIPELEAWELEAPTRADSAESE